MTVAKVIDVSTLTYKEKYSKFKQYKKLIQNWTRRTFGFDILENDGTLHASTNIFSQCGIFYKIDHEHFIAHSPFFKQIVAVELVDRMFIEQFGPRDLIIVSRDSSIDTLSAEQIAGVKHILDADWIDRDSNGVLTTGGGPNSLSPLNGSNILFFHYAHEIVNDKKDMVSNVIGHAHTIHQFFNLSILEQALNNIHFTNSTIYTQPETVYELIARHLKIDIRIIKND